MDTVVRRIGGTAAAVLVVALMVAGFRWASGPPADSYTVVAELGRAGSGLNVGTDVKARGVRLGSVTAIRYDDGVAFATLRLQGEPRLPSSDEIDLTVTPKTLLGEKQVELAFPDDRFGQEPFLEPDDVLVASREPTELETVLDEFEPFIDSIDGPQLAAIIDAFAAQRGEGPAIAENIELGQQVASFAERTAEDNLANLRRLADVADALAARGEDFNRFNDNLQAATSLLPDRQPAVRASLEALSRFSVGFAEFLEVEEDDIDVLLRLGDVAGVVFERRADDIGNLVDGLFKYFRELGRGGGFLTDGTEYAFFRILLDQEGISLANYFCQEGIEPPEEFGDCPEPTGDGEGSP